MGGVDKEEVGGVEVEKNVDCKEVKGMDMENVGKHFYSC